ncbi:MAG: dTDP-4-dehydrorhamnose reductase [Gammaproteobacteria bacterium]|nr:dTDP-4-dehydrorhamnose reductase [Gammaproteobacteria bacterium]
MPRILVIGSSGQIGHELRRTLTPLGEVTTAGRTEADFALDLSYPSQIENVLREIAAEVVVNAAAYTAVDQAQSEREAAFAVNSEAPAVMARMAKQSRALLVHFSTDYVFSGETKLPYTEEDETGPLGVYGESKLEGERGIHAVGGRHLILRTSWVYGLRGKNFLRTVLRLATERDSLRIVDDQFGVPNWCRTLAEGTAAVLSVIRSDPARFKKISDVYHLSARGETTWCGFASTIVEALQGEPGILAKRVEPIATREYPTPAKRPKRSSLDASRLAQDFGVSLPDWRECLQRCLGERNT